MCDRSQVLSGKHKSLGNVYNYDSQLALRLGICVRGTYIPRGNCFREHISRGNIYPYNTAIFSISQPKNSLTAESFLTCNNAKREAMERIYSLHYAFMCRSGTQIKLPPRLPMSQVSQSHPRAPPALCAKSVV